jgi:protein O-mannosyl-transferase
MKPTRGRAASRRAVGRSPAGQGITGRTAAGPADRRGGWSRDWLLALLLVAALAAVYQPVWHAGFIWDDDDHLTQNPCVVGPLGFKAIWTTSAAIYYPLVLTSFWLGHALWGLNPLPFHLLNVCAHAGCGLLLWRVLRALKVPGAWLGASLWALHPVQVESVAWITELKNTQSGLFFLLAILCFLRWRDRGREGDYALALAGATLAILSKASTVMLPVVLALCCWWRDGSWRWRQALRLAPFLLIAGLASAWTIWEQRFHSGAQGAEWAQTWPERLVIAGRAVWFYLGKLAWPHPLIFIYPRWTLEASRASSYLPALAVAITLLLLGWAGAGSGRIGLGTSPGWKPARAGFFAFACFVVLLFPVLGFFNIYFFRYSFVGDHFQYLASMGPLALAGAGAALALRRCGRLMPPVLAGGLLALLGGMTWHQSRVYQDNETLFQATLERNPGCWIAGNNLGLVLLATGRTVEAKARLEAALALKPEYADAHNNLGAALELLGQRPAALEHYRRATELNPDYTEAWANLAVACFLASRPIDGLPAARKAVALARAKGQPALARKVEPWLEIYHGN